jgi:hypothetical protein
MSGCRNLDAGEGLQPLIELLIKLDFHPFWRVRVIAWTAITPRCVMGVEQRSLMRAVGSQLPFGVLIPPNDATLPPISPMFLNTTLNSTAYPGVTAPFVIPAWVMAAINAMHSSW